MALPSVSAPIYCTPYQRCGYSYTTVVKTKEGEEEERGMMGTLEAEDGREIKILGRFPLSSSDKGWSGSSMLVWRIHFRLPIKMNSLTYCVQAQSKPVEHHPLVLLQGSEPMDAWLQIDCTESKVCRRNNYKLWNS